MYDGGKYKYDDGSGSLCQSGKNSNNTEKDEQKG